jgi:RNA 2',3'-cyclic 3'-phosphodiesterase
MTDQPIRQQRLFYALWPDEATRQRLTQLQAPLQGQKTHPDDLHLTLVFLGDRPADLLPVFQKILMGLPPIDTTLVLDHMGFFQHNKIVWAGTTAPPSALLQLQNTLAQELIRHQIPFEDDHAFKAHITLARKADAPGEMPLDPIIWQADKIALVRSRANAKGARYEVVALR